MTKNIESYAITNPPALDDIPAAHLRKVLNLPLVNDISFPMYKTYYEGKEFFCCVCVGYMKDGKPWMTEASRAKLLVLAKLPAKAGDEMIVKELRRGAVPIRKKVKDLLRTAPNNARVCFFGDFAGDNDRDIMEALQVVGTCVVPTVA